MIAIQVPMRLRPDWSSLVIQWISLQSLHTIHHYVVKIIHYYRLLI